MNYLSIVLSVALAAQCLGFSQNRPSYDTGSLGTSVEHSPDSTMLGKLKETIKIPSEEVRPRDFSGLTNPDILSQRNSDSADEQMQDQPSGVLLDLTPEVKVLDLGAAIIIKD